MIRFLINIPDELHKTLKEQAKPKGQTLNGLIRQILWEWIESKKVSINNFTEKDQEKVS